MKIIEIILVIIRCVIFLWAGWKFVTGDKEKISTLWYGMFLITLMI